MFSSHRSTLSYFTNSLNMAIDSYVILLDLLFIRHGRVIRTALLPVFSFLIQILSEKTVYISKLQNLKQPSLFIFVKNESLFFIKLL